MQNRWLAPSLFLAACAGLCPPAAAQSQVVLQEDFEGGFGLWTASGGWHVTQPGDCGVGLTRAAKFGKDCGYGPSFQKLTSPAFSAPAGADLILTMDALWDMDDAPLEHALQIGLGNGHSGISILQHFHAADKGVLKTITVQYPMEGEPSSDPWTLELSLTADAVGNTGKGLFLDNIRIVTNAATDLGVTEPAGPTQPALVWWGEFTPGSSNILSAELLPPFAPALLITGDVLAPVQVQGLLVNPVPLVVLPLLTPGPLGGDDGHAAIEFPIDGPLLPPGAQVFVQLLTKDATGAWSASNTLLVSAP